MARQHSARVLEMQRSIFRRVPYRGYFGRLGRFIQLVHGQNQPDREPLLPFTDGVVGPPGRHFVYAHVDIVKCATRSPWSELSRADKALLVASCLPHLDGQMRSHGSLELLLVNGRTAYTELATLLGVLGASLHARSVPLHSRTATLAVGSLQVGDRKVRIVAWTANVVNQHLAVAETQALAHAVAEAVSAAVGP